MEQLFSASNIILAMVICYVALVLGTIKLAHQALRLIRSSNEDDWTRVGEKVLGIALFFIGIIPGLFAVSFCAIPYFAYQFFLSPEIFTQEFVGQMAPIALFFLPGVFLATLGGAIWIVYYGLRTFRRARSKKWYLRPLNLWFGTNVTIVGLVVLGYVAIFTWWGSSFAVSLFGIAMDYMLNSFGG